MPKNWPYGHVWNHSCPQIKASGWGYFKRHWAQDEKFGFGPGSALTGCVVLPCYIAILSFNLFMHKKRGLISKITVFKHYTMGP